MSGLHTALHNPSIPGESVLSFLFNARDADETFQKEILQHLNRHDALNIRQANSRLNAILRGRPILINRYDSRGNLAYQLPNNSVLYALGARCNGRRIVGNGASVPCNTAPLDDIRIANVRCPFLVMCPNIH